jgi:hypothetical protein
MAAVMGAASRSFLRHREFAEPLGDMIVYERFPKKEVLEAMHRMGNNERAVFFAENLQTMTPEEIRAHLAELASRLNRAGASGFIEFHPSADTTSKSAHIHYWGSDADAFSRLIEDYIKEERLSNKPFLNYTNEELFQSGHYHRLNEEGELEEVVVRGREEEIVKREEYDEEEVAAKKVIEEGTIYDEIISYCDDLLAELGEEAEWAPKVEELDMSEIFDYINELELEMEI